LGDISGAPSVVGTPALSEIRGHHYQLYVSSISGLKWCVMNYIEHNTCGNVVVVVEERAARADHQCCDLQKLEDMMICRIMNDELMMMEEDRG
jgi:hypothetical protein